MYFQKTESLLCVNFFQIVNFRTPQFFSKEYKDRTPPGFKSRVRKDENPLIDACGEIIKNVNICARKDCEIKIESDLETKAFNIKGKEKVQKVRLGVRGETFSISFITKQEGQKISNPQFEIDVLL